MDRVAETTAQILRATAQLIEEHGIDRLSTTDVAARAKVSIGTVYRHLGDRDALIRALYEDHVLEVRETLVAIASRSHGDVRADVHAVLTGYVRLHRTLPAYQAVRTWQWLHHDTRGDRRAAIDACVAALVATLSPRYRVVLDDDQVVEIAEAIDRTDALVLAGFLDGRSVDEGRMQSTVDAIEAMLVEWVLDALQR